ncbi:hypothetical protein FRC02_006889 [Tulasnella sp. 418]|nr:hypothetical protein FRC02_006889 [Tulasnella sp. 418]
MAARPLLTPRFRLRSAVCGTSILSQCLQLTYTQQLRPISPDPACRLQSSPPITSAHQSRPQSSVSYAYPTSSSVYPVQYNPYYVAAAAAAAYYQTPANAYRYHNQVSLHCPSLTSSQILPTHDYLGMVPLRLPRIPFARLQSLSEVLNESSEPISALSQSSTASDEPMVEEQAVSAKDIEQKYRQLAESRDFTWQRIPRL